MKKESASSKASSKSVKGGKRKADAAANVAAMTDTVEITEVTVPQITDVSDTSVTEMSEHSYTAAINGNSQPADQLAGQLAGQLVGQITNCNQDRCNAKDCNGHKTNDFPVDVLPARLLRIINEAHATLGFPKDYLAGAMLTAIGAAIGNTHKVEHIPGWKEYAILFVALVGAPGSNKSHPLSFAMQPLIDFDAEQAALYSEAMKRYNATMELPTKERVANGYEQNPTEPIRLRFTMQDVTSEAVHRILSENPRGLCLVSDELAGWFKNFNRYNNGSESEFWMSVFNHKVAMSDRKSSQSGVLIKSPFLCVIGTIQPKVLVELAGNNRNANGFMERILFVMPTEQPKVKWNRDSNTPAFDLAAEWKSVLGTLIDIEPKTAANGDIEPEDVPFTADALDRLFSWQNEVTERCNAERSDTLTSIASKLEIYAVRFCLLLSLADWACGARKKKTIDAATVGRAIRLTEYFRRTAAQVQGIVSEAVMSEAQLNMMEDLPDKFTTAEGIAAALKNGISERTFKRMLSGKYGMLFTREAHGKYSKL